MALSVTCLLGCFARRRRTKADGQLQVPKNMCFLKPQTGIDFPLNALYIYHGKW
jgi:hypothetical protein